MDSNVSQQGSASPDISSIATGHFDRTSEQYSHPHSQKRQYRIYIPTSAGEGPLPLVMVLHGCEQTHADIQTISQFDQVAEQNGFAVVYPFVTKYPDFRNINCWGWWREEQISANSGEVEDLWKIAEEVIDEFNIDRNSVHITGLSAGGAMAAAALVVHGNRFASGAAVAGLAYGETIYAVQQLFGGRPTYQSLENTVSKMKSQSRDDSTLPPLCIIHSQGDNIVDIQAGKNLRDSWLQFLSPDKLSVRSTEEHEQDDSHWSHTCYGIAEDRAFVETIFFEKLRHGWYGGEAGSYSFPDAPDISSLMWTFFEKHSLNKLEITEEINTSDENIHDELDVPIVSLPVLDSAEIEIQPPEYNEEETHAEIDNMQEEEEIELAETEAEDKSRNIRAEEDEQIVLQAEDGLDSPTNIVNSSNFDAPKDIKTVNQKESAPCVNNCSEGNTEESSNSDTEQQHKDQELDKAPKLETKSPFELSSQNIFSQFIKRIKTWFTF